MRTLLSPNKFKSTKDTKGVNFATRCAKTQGNCFLVKKPLFPPKIHRKVKQKSNSPVAAVAELVLTMELDMEDMDDIILDAVLDAVLDAILDAILDAELPVPMGAAAPLVAPLLLAAVALAEAAQEADVGSVTPSLSIPQSAHVEPRVVLSYGAGGVRTQRKARWRTAQSLYGSHCQLLKYPRPSLVQRLTCLICWGACRRHTTGQLANQVGVRADALDVQCTTSTKRAADA